MIRLKILTKFIYQCHLISKVNDDHNFLIPYEAFYIQSAQEKIDLQMDYRVFKFRKVKALSFLQMSFVACFLLFILF